MTPTLTPLTHIKDAHLGKIAAKPACPKAAGAVTSPSDRRASGTARQIFQSVQEWETAQIITSPLIVQPVPNPPQVHRLPELRLDNLDSRLFIAQDKIRDQKSGGSTLVFKLRPEFNIVQNGSLEEFWVKMKSMQALLDQHDDTADNVIALIGLFAPDDIFCQYVQLIRTFIDVYNEQYKHIFTDLELFENFKHKYENSVVNANKEREKVRKACTGIEEMNSQLGYSLKFCHDGVYLTLPDPLLLNHRLKSLYEDKPSLPRVKISYYDEGISDMDLIKSYLFSDVLIPTGHGFVFRMLHLSDILCIMLETEAKKKGLYAKGTDVFKNRVTHYYNLIQSVKSQLRLQMTTGYFYQLKLNKLSVADALKLAQLNLATVVKMWLTHFDFDTLNNMTKDKFGTLLLGYDEWDTGIDYTREFAMRGEIYDRKKIAAAWSTLEDYLKK